MPRRAPAKPLVRSHNLPPMDHTGGHKESQYDPRIGAEICARLEAGETVRQVAADPAMPSYATIFQWRKVWPDFAEMYDAMRARVAAAKIERADLARRSKVYWRIHKARVDGKRPRDWVSGKKSTYDRAWAQAWCDRVAAGEAGYRVSAEPGMPSQKCIYTWLKRFPEFRAMYAQARAQQRFGLDWRIYLEVDRVGDGGDLATAKRATARLEGRRGRLTPKVWKTAPPERTWAEPPGGGMRPTKG